MYLTDQGMSPSLASDFQPSLPSLSSIPDIVKVLPEPVWPYAKIVAAYPSRADWMRSWTPHSSKTMSCLQASSKALLYQNILLLAQYESFMCLSSGVSTTDESFLPFSSSLKGLILTTTLTLSPPEKSPKPILTIAYHHRLLLRQN